jgi:hypothetical protein
MRIKPFLVTIGVCLCFLVFSLSLRASLSRRGRGPTVTVAVQATDNSGGTLRYQWKSTDGTIQNVNAASTTWTLPAGPGVHFASVLVSNGLGGYTERRIAVNTDTIGTKVEKDDDFTRVTAPPAPEPPTISLPCCSNSTEPTRPPMAFAHRRPESCRSVYTRVVWPHLLVGGGASFSSTCTILWAGNTHS